MKTNSYPRICANCKWWVPRDEDEEQYSDCGSCHRYPPEFEHQTGSCYFPETDAGIWCAEFAVMQHLRISSQPTARFADAPTLALVA